ncbi:hypothetical protein AB6A40_009063 [Gnathostoma spinigerum]|uniref:Organic solute transporter subunit alpha n=1 Tax=Gnathostoma spinigerum TaxID=75299 RepID=A0ABD6EYM8_9BILA
MIVDTVIKLLSGSLINCSDHKTDAPTAREFLRSIDGTYIVILLISAVISAATIALGLLHIAYVYNYVTHRFRKCFIIYLAGTAPLISLFALIAMFMPRVWFLAHLLGFLYFSIALWVIICLLLNIFDGRRSLVKKINETTSRITVQTPPICCFFPCLPSFDLDMKKIRCCELMVIQAAFFRLLFTLVSLVLFFEYHNGALVALKITDYISLPSLLIGLYGTHILVTAVSQVDELLPYRYVIVFRLLDFYFAFFGLQHPIFDLMARAGVFGCGTAMPALETAFFWKNFAVIIESFFVTLISSVLLKPSRSALFDKYPSGRSTNSSQTIQESDT